MLICQYFTCDRSFIFYCHTSVTSVTYLTNIIDKTLTFRKLYHKTLTLFYLLENQNLLIAVSQHAFADRICQIYMIQIN